MMPVRTIRRITDLIVTHCHPERVLLFGSYAKGQDNKESDLDILVIGDFREAPFLRGQDVRQYMRRYPIRVDLHFMTVKEVEREKRKAYGFINSILTSGIELYQKNEILY